MSLLRSFALIAVLTTAGTVSADTPVKAPTADKKAPAKDAKDPKDTKDAAKDEVSTADAAKFLAFFNKFVDTIVANKDSCPKMAASMNALISANQDVIKMANAATAAGKRLPKTVDEKMSARIQEMIPAMQKCGNDKDVQTAMQRLGGDKPAAPAAPPAAPPAKK